MLEIIKNPNVNWLGTKKWFILISTGLLLVGAISAFQRGFNLGIDFAGGTLVTVNFKESNPPESEIRAALARQGIDPGKVVFQPVRDPTSGKLNQMLIRLPQREEAQLEREQPTGPSQGSARAKTEATSTPSGGPPAPGTALTQAPDGATPGAGSTGLAEQLGAEKRAIAAALESFNPPDEVANKVDLNTIGRTRLRDRLAEFDPLGLIKQSGQGVATSEYERYANLMIDFREQKRDGLIGDINELKGLPGVPRQLVDALPEHFFAGVARMVSAEIVGPQIGEELRQRAIYVVLASFAGMLLYIAFRFEWIYGVAAVIAVVHDLLITFGVFSILQKEISLTVVAAFLTLAGYSVNDTIVIFDRIRENLRLRRRESLTKLVNDSINQTLSRTILTSGLTLCAIVFLVVFGGPVLNGFAWALLIGILVGTYSSVAIASPVMVWWQQFQAVRAQRAARRMRQIKRKAAAS